MLGGATVPLREKLSLALGANFRPIPPLIPHAQFAQAATTAYQRFNRSLRLMDCFGTESAGSVPRLRVQNPSFEPDDTHPSIQRYTNNTTRLFSNILGKLESLDIMKRGDVNTRSISTLKTYLDTSSLVVAKADKNLGLVVIPIDSYHQSMSRYLAGPAFRPISQSHALAIQRRAYHRILRASDNLFPPDDRDRRPPLHSYITANTPIPSEAKPIVPYIMLKVHKLSRTSYSTGSTIPPPRLLAPCFGTISEAASRVVDQLIYPVYSRANPWHLHSSRDLIIKLETTTFPPYCAFGQQDIKSMYPNIPIDKAVNYFRCFCLEYNVEGVEYIISFLVESLKSNILFYNNQHYLQTHGTAMGIPAACVFANVFVFYLEKDLVNKALNNNQCLFYSRLMDDIFAIFPSEYDANNFFSQWNTLDPNTQLEGNITKDRAIILDLVVYKGPRFNSSSILDITLYQKSFNLYTYIPFSSFHPLSSKRAWLNGELRRIVMNCSSSEEYFRYRDLFIWRLLARKYPTHIIKDACSRVRYNLRPTYLAPSNRRTERRPKKAIFIAKYTPQWLSLQPKAILSRHWQQLVTEHPHSGWENVPLVLAYTRSKNLYACLRDLQPK